MKYTKLKISQGSGIGMERACVQCGAIVEPASRGNHPHDPAYCATCGHKFNRIKDGYTSEELADILNDMISRHLDKEPGGPSAVDPMAIGPGPYVASLVRASDGGTLFVAPDEYHTVASAVHAALDEAKKRGMPVDPDLARHWITNKKEHIVDFGSHSIYACVVSAGSEK